MTLRAAFAIAEPVLGLAGTPSPNNPDTAIGPNQCYESGSNALVGCARTDLMGQDGQDGRDVDPTLNTDGDGRLGLSFTKMCNSGQLAGSGTCPADPELGSGLAPPEHQG